MDLLRRRMPADVAWTADLKMAIAHGGPEAAWRILRLRTGEWLEDRDVALHYGLVAQAHPAEAETETLVAIAEAFRADGGVILSAIAGLNAKAARRPLDAPPRDEGPEHQAARLAARALEEDWPPEIAAYLHINRANALRAMGPQSDAAAVESYARALELDEDNGAWHFDLAVCHKWRGRWQLAFDESLRARSRMGATKGVVWNIALSATALGEGDLAAGAWRDLGIDSVTLGKGGLPLVEGVPMRRVRVRCRPAGYGFSRHNAGFEVLQVAPLSPGHGVVVTPSFEDSPIDYGDIVLFDGAPVDVDEEGPVFPALEILRAGDEQRYRFAAIVREGELEALVTALGDVRAFVHPAAGEVGGDESLVYGKFIAGIDADPRVLAERLEAHGKATKTLRIAVPELYEAIGDTRRAGQEHQSWRGIERVAVKRGLAVDEST